MLETLMTNLHIYKSSIQFFLLFPLLSRFDCSVWLINVNKFRFCGPPTTVNVLCTAPPRRCVRTLGRAVSLTGECYTSQITLLPYQFDLINSAPPKVILAGPPGTGKSVVLQLMATVWLRLGSDVYIMSTCDSSRASCAMLHHLLEQTAKVTSDQLHLLHYDLSTAGQIEAAVNNMAQAALARKGRLHVIADEAGPDV